MSEREITAERTRPLTGLEEAIEMSDWFPDYVAGITDEQGRLPRLTRIRLKRHFGDFLSEGLALVRNEIPMLPEDIQPDVAAYICGFPEDDLNAILEHKRDEVVRTLDAVFPPALRVRSVAQGIGSSGLRVMMKEPDPNPDEDKLAWQVDALCAQTDPEAFFPEKGGSTRDAKRICTSCEVRSQCLDYALANDERFGIWGGLSERERRKLRKKNTPAPTETYAEASEKKAS